MRGSRRRRRMGGRHLVGAGVAAALIVAGWSDLDLDGRTPPPEAAAPVVVDVDLGDLLARVPVVEEIRPKPGYERGCGTDKSTGLREGCVFGPAWNDPLDRSGCDTRSRLLAASLRDVIFKAGTRNCKPIAGTLDPDPYTGQVVDFKDVEAEHIYSLSRAWDAGAWAWDPQRRQVFANDMVELLAVSRAANRAKSDAGLEWLPDFQPCAHVHRYLIVAVKYQLPITVAERDIAARACEARPVA